MSSTRALNAILPSISTAPYEAHQKARTFASRYVSKGQYDTAIEVLFESSKELLKLDGGKGKGSGVDLGGFLVEVYETKGEIVSEVSRGRLTQLIALTGPSGTWRKPLIDKSIAWSAKHGEWPQGDPTLLQYVADVHIKEGSYDLAEPLLLGSGTRDAARLLASAYASWSAPTPGALGAFALRGVLPYLLAGNVAAARVLVLEIVSSCPSASSPPVQVDDHTSFTPSSDSLLTLAQLIVFTCQRAGGSSNKVMRESWVRLCGTFGRGVGDEVRKALSELGTLYFAMPAPRSQGGIGELMAGMFGGAPAGGAGEKRWGLTAPALRIEPNSGGLD